MPLFSNKISVEDKASASLSTSSAKSSKSASNSFSAQPRRAVMAPWFINSASLIIMGLLVLLSLSIGVADFSWSGILQSLISHSANSDSSLMLVSRLPRTIAIILTGIAMAVAGMIIQVVLKNRFVEPSMVGATQSAALGLLVVSLLFPASALIIKMGVATIAALFGMMLFMLLIHRIPPTDFLMIPLIGIVFGGIIEAVTTFIAYQTESLQMLSVWQFGDFSGVLAGRYELLWLTGVLCVLAYIIADKLTIIGLGDNIALNLGISKRHVTWIGVGMVAMMSAVVVVTVGMIPFIGLVVPNIVSRLMGDKLRRSLPAVALLGASAVLLCDIIGRSIRYPFEVPVATVFGVVGTVLFLWLLLRAPAEQ
ncbi:iron chelate uptake ABC transporter family permease subunit [Psychrobacter sp. Sa4CVA2]|uniref:Iron chelate uptake ABC transporter family permease subunit n=2 Tax=Moraxellaceae TaxID=468 RepID=A0ABR8RL62_9GAMM|nr:MULTISPECIES: iron chelate uptake ABC transporter family permease subunit [Psychrobacter]MBD7948501.1 iron chelate uptake ABC transporter family permease subunit [Psychrobacter communis]WGV11964.1 iron chelate uptake ABC transporter family permease subunit [Psychrobacter sp. WB2]